MNEVVHSKQVVFPGNYNRLADYVVNITREYIELQVPTEIMAEHFDWDHSTCKELFISVSVEDATEFCCLGCDQVLINPMTTVKMYYKPEVRYQLFPNTQKY